MVANPSNTVGCCFRHRRPRRFSISFIFVTLVIYILWTPANDFPDTVDGRVFVSRQILISYAYAWTREDIDSLSVRSSLTVQKFLQLNVGSIRSNLAQKLDSFQLKVDELARCALKIPRCLPSRLPLPPSRRQSACCTCLPVVVGAHTVHEILVVAKLVCFNTQNICPNLPHSLDGCHLE